MITMEDQELYNIVKEITDPLDPTSMEKLFPYYDEIVKVDDEFFELLVKNLNGVSIYWDQPWYQRHGKISRPPVFKVVDETDPYLTGSITQSEREIIEMNWRKLIKKYNLPDQLISLCRWKNIKKDFKSAQERARRFVIAYLARGLKRNLYQVLRHINTYYTTPNNCDRYSPVEEKVIEVCLNHNPTRACRIASVILHREPRAIYNKIKALTNGKPEERKKIIWKLPIASKFLRSLLEHSQLTLEQLKYAKLDKSVWLKCQKDMDHSYLYLRSFWHAYLHVQLFVNCDVKLYTLKKNIFYKLQNSDYKIWTDIQWKKVLEEFPDGMTQLFIYRMANDVLKKCPNYRKIPLEKVLKFGYHKIKLLKYNNKRLRRLVFKDGELSVKKVDDNDNIKQE